MCILSIWLLSRWKKFGKRAGIYGCPESCAQSKYGCCPDGQTASRGPNKEGCPCQYSRWGCCKDGQTTAIGPHEEGCDDCRYGKYGCCQDGSSKAFGPDFAGCPTTTPAPYMLGGTVSPSTIVASCGLPQDQGQVCSSSYKLAWYYDMAEARCAQFWYGGCGGNENRFGTQEQCEQICVDPPGLGRCYLPKVEGSKRCEQLTPRYSYDYISKQCTAFWHTGCLGNSNNFLSWEECQSFCAGADASQVQVNIVPYRGPIPISPQHNLQPPLIPQQQLPQQPPPPPPPPPQPPQQQPIIAPIVPSIPEESRFTYFK
uniref:BPTI/Kunitz inhibitor domain-containing protein n=1 Tax=Meloidogyne enterolobii TaxID=390850 RepID=A0A6V7Y3P3_MELEN|nr:unnamed protein product [Meloidogyne enterolobii]